MHFPLLPPMARIYATSRRSFQQWGILSFISSSQLTLCLLLISLLSNHSQDPSSVPFQHIAAAGEPIIPSIHMTFPPELAHYKATFYGVSDLKVMLKLRRYRNCGERFGSGTSSMLLLCRCIQGHLLSMTSMEGHRILCLRICWM